MTLFPPEFTILPIFGTESAYLLCLTLYMKDGRLHYVHNWVGRALYSVTSEADVPAGKHELRFEFEPTGQPDLPARQGRSGPDAALRRRVSGRQRGGADDDAVHAQPWRPDLRRQPGLSGHSGLPQPVQVHRHPTRGDRGRERRPNPRFRGRLRMHMSRQ